MRLLSLEEVHELNGQGLNEFCAGFGGASIIYGVGVSFGWVPALGQAATVGAAIIGLGCVVYTLT